MKSLIQLILLISFAGALGLIGFNLVQSKLSPSIGRLSVNVSDQKARVYLDGNFIGTTPLYAKNLPLGDHLVKVEPEKTNDSKFSWQTNTTLTSSTISTIDLDLAPNKEFTSGESLYFQAGNKTLSILSRPDSATVIIDQKERGKTPLSLTLSKGVHQVLIRKEGYLDREVPINIEDSYKLSAVVYLALNPFEKVVKLDSNNKVSLFLLGNLHSDLAKDPDSWVKGISFVQKDFNSSQTRFDVLIDSKGRLYIPNKTEWENKKQSRAVSVVGYLAKPSESKLSTAAEAEWVKIKNLFN